MTMLSIKHYLLWLALALISVFAGPVHAAAGGPRQVVLLLSDSSALYQETAQTLRAELNEEAGKLVVKSVVAGDALADISPDTLLVSIGFKAAQMAVKTDAPLLAVLVSRQAFDGVTASLPPVRKRTISAIYLDQPPARQLSLIKASLSSARNVGVLFGPGQIHSQGEWASAMRAAGLNLVPLVAPGSGELFQSLQAALPNVDTLLLLPDPAIVNRGTVQNLMLTTYRQRVAVVGYSQALVDAGSLFAVYSTPQQIGQQAGEMVMRLSSGRSWEMPAPVYPKYFTVKSNASVSRALELAIPSDATLLQRLGGGGPREIGEYAPA